eukprot:scaffold223_cov96-Skeletonema_dohrnii-CCMP3373.AAC.11
MLVDPIRLPLRRHGVGIYSILQHLICYSYGTTYSYSLRNMNEDRKNFAQCFVSFAKGSSSQAVPPSIHRSIVICCRLCPQSQEADRM